MVPESTVNIPVQARLDITRDRCPMTYVRVRLALDRLAAGDVLLVELQGEEPLKNVPASAERQGHEVVRLDRVQEGISLLWIRKR